MNFFQNDISIHQESVIFILIIYSRTKECINFVSVLISILNQSKIECSHKESTFLQAFLVKT